MQNKNSSNAFFAACFAFLCFGGGVALIVIVAAGVTGDVSPVLDAIVIFVGVVMTLISLCLACTFCDADDASQPNRA